MAINPSAEIAGLLINSAYGEQWLNAQTEKDWGENTALHIAATNGNVTREFIEKFKEARADSRILNSQNDTPYHAAAKSSNQETIIYMLDTFSPTNNSWDVDEVDSESFQAETKAETDAERWDTSRQHRNPEGSNINKEKGRRQKDTVINICARNGNAKAVSLLIKHEADISQGVLHEIVLESVRNPDKIDKLLTVYETVVHTAVKWRTLEEQTEFLKSKGPNNYTEVYRKTAIWLLTMPLEQYGNTNVIQCALDHGASAMLWRIINTVSVFRFDGAEAAKLFDKQCGNDAEEISHKNRIGYVNCTTKKRTNRYWTVIDVTNFVEDTTISQSNLSDLKRVGFEKDALLNHNINLLPRCNFDELPPPSKPYLTSLLLAFDQWKSSNILCTQPLKDLTQPYIALVQRFYFILGLLQLIFMICFTAFHMPTTCSLARMFNVSNTLCNSSVSDLSSDNELLSLFSHQRSWSLVLWLMWPIILSAILTFVTVHYVEQVTLASRQHSEKIVLKTKDLRLSFGHRFLEVLLQLPLPTFFCIAMFVWFGVCLIQSYEYYIDVTGMVLLLGWIANLHFFGAMKKDFSIFSLVVSKMILKDIPSFMLHALHMSFCSPNELTDQTFFSVLFSAFGIGDYFEITRADLTCGSGGIQYTFEIAYFLYMCATMIILLNVLIAVLNDSYRKAKWKAEIIWRFQMLSVMRAFECHRTLANAMKKCLMPNRPDGSLFYKGERYNRFYLRLVLPVDEQLVDGTIVTTPVSASSRHHPLVS